MRLSSFTLHPEIQMEANKEASPCREKSAVQSEITAHHDDKEAINRESSRYDSARTSATANGMSFDLKRDTVFSSGPGESVNSRFSSDLGFNSDGKKNGGILPPGMEQFNRQTGKEGGTGMMNHTVSCLQNTFASDLGCFASHSSRFLSGISVSSLLRSYDAGHGATGRDDTQRTGEKSHNVHPEKPPMKRQPSFWSAAVQEPASAASSAPLPPPLFASFSDAVASAKFLSGVSFSSVSDNHDKGRVSEQTNGAAATRKGSLDFVTPQTFDLGGDRDWVSGYEGNFRTSESGPKTLGPILPVSVPPPQITSPKKNKKKLRDREPDVKVYFEPRDNDVLFGRGDRANKHPGNVLYRNRISSLQTSYQQASTVEKTRLSQTIVDEVCEGGGRFLKQDPDGRWYQVTNANARNKASQALRTARTIAKRAENRRRHRQKKQLIANQKFTKSYR